MSLKSHFIQLSIKNQILCGMYCLSIIISLIVFLLVFATSFLLITISYDRMKLLIESKENKIMDFFNSFGDISANVFMDIGKLEILILRRHQNFLLSHTEYLMNINNNTANEERQNKYVVNKTTINKCVNPSECIFFIVPDVSKQIPFEETNYTKMLMLTMPINKMILRSKYYDNNDIPVIEKIHFISNNSIFYQYPANLANQTAPGASIPIVIEKIKAKYKYEHLAIIKGFNTIGNMSYVNFTLNNPGIFSTLSTILYPPPYTPLMLPSTISIDFKVNNYADVSNESFDKFSNYTGLFWSEIIIDRLSLSLSAQIKGLYAIILANVNKYPVLSPSSCQLIKRLAYFYTNPEQDYTTSNDKSPYATLGDCFQVEEANRTIQEITQKNITTDLRRELIVPLASYKEEFDVNNILQFKVLFSLFPSKSIHSLINSPFYFTFPIVFLFLKNINGNLIIINRLSDYFQNIVLLIVSVFLIVWILVFIYIIIRVYSVAREISDPIQKLINSISMNMLEDGNDKMDSITYKDDKDINDLFKICKELIFGGFNQGAVLKKDNQLNVYNNIAIVKSNNVMINEYNIEGKRDEDVDLLFGNCDENEDEGEVGKDEHKEEHTPLKKFENEVYKKYTTKEYENEIGNYLKKTMMEENKDGKRKGKKAEGKIGCKNKDDFKKNDDLYPDINKEMEFLKKIASEKKITFRNNILNVKYNEIFFNEGKEKKK